MRELSEQLGLDLPPSLLLEYPTAAALSNHLSNLVPTASSGPSPTADTTTLRSSDDEGEHSATPEGISPEAWEALDDDLRARIAAHLAEALAVLPESPLNEGKGSRLRNQRNRSYSLEEKSDEGGSLGFMGKVKGGRGKKFFPAQ